LKFTGNCRLEHHTRHDTVPRTMVLPFARVGRGVQAQRLGDDAAAGPAGGAAAVEDLPSDSEDDDFNPEQHRPESSSGDGDEGDPESEPGDEDGTGSESGEDEDAPAGEADVGAANEGDEAEAAAAEAAAAARGEVVNEESSGGEGDDDEDFGPGVSSSEVAELVRRQVALHMGTATIESTTRLDADKHYIPKHGKLLSKIMTPELQKLLPIFAVIVAGVDKDAVEELGLRDLVYMPLGVPGEECMPWEDVSDALRSTVLAGTASFIESMCPSFITVPELSSAARIRNVLRDVMKSAAVAYAKAGARAGAGAGSDGSDTEGAAHGLHGYKGDKPIPTGRWAKMLSSLSSAFHVSFGSRVTTPLVASRLLRAAGPSASSGREECRFPSEQIVDVEYMRPYEDPNGHVMSHADTGVMTVSEVERRVQTKQNKAIVPETPRAAFKLLALKMYTLLLVLWDVVVGSTYESGGHGGYMGTPRHLTFQGVRDFLSAYAALIDLNYIAPGQLLRMFRQDALYMSTLTTRTGDGKCPTIGAVMVSCSQQVRLRVLMSFPQAAPVSQQAPGEGAPGSARKAEKKRKAELKRKATHNGGDDAGGGAQQQRGGGAAAGGPAAAKKNAAGERVSFNGSFPRKKGGNDANPE